MRGNARLIWLAVLAAVALALAACGRDDEEGGGDPGIDDESLKLGGSYPFSGPASAYRSIAVGARAHFKSVNAEGGVVLPQPLAPRRSTRSPERKSRSSCSMGRTT